MTISTWEFDSDITPIFDDHVKKHVPLYTEIHDMITSLAGWYIEDGTNVYDIGTSLGEVIHNLTEAYPSKRINYFGIDSSFDMSEKAKARFLSKGNIEIINACLPSDKVLITNASLITSILTLMFIPHRKRAQVIEEVYGGMNTGSAFIVVEKIIGNNARFDEMWIEMYHDMKYKNGVSEVEIFNKSRSIRGILKPNTIDENTNLLSSAGFKEVDVFFKWGNFAGFIAIK